MQKRKITNFTPSNHEPKECSIIDQSELPVIEEDTSTPNLDSSVRNPFTASEDQDQVQDSTNT